MCYSAQIKAAYVRFVREYGATISLDAFVELYGFRLESAKPVRIPKAVDSLVGDVPAAHELIERYAAQQGAAWEQELFRQRKRLADAKRKLADKPTQAALDDQRIAGAKVAQLLARLSDLRRAEVREDDGRFFPGWWVPVMVNEGGQRVVKPMRYQCRPAGKPAFYDIKYPGTYNARRDKLDGFWKGLWAQTHGLICVNAFYENVALDGGNAVLEFRPRPAQDMLVACLWSRWEAKDGAVLYSFAAITDEPPAEVAAAGHDRCIIPLKPQHVDAWLDPRGDTAAMHAILDDRERPFYAHRLAA